MEIIDFMLERLGRTIEIVFTAISNKYCTDDIVKKYLECGLLGHW